MFASSEGSDEKVSEYDQEIPQSETGDQPTAPRGRATDYLQLQDIRKKAKAKQPVLSSSSRNLFPYSVCESREGFDETVRMCSFF